MNIFGVLPQSLAAMKQPQLPGIQLPQTFDEAIQTGLMNNPTMKAARLSTLLATETKNQSTAGMLPKIEAIWDRKEKDDIAGTAGKKTEEIAKINLTWTFNLGFREFYNDAANAKAIVGSAAREVDAERNAREEIGSAFRILALSRQTAAFLSRQVESAEQFLDLARKEREMGKRSLLDVLSGEATLAGAKSDALSAEMDVLLATYNLLRAMGKLDVGSITAMK
jgi:adhesin transport system outer membrane protein